MRAFAVRGAARVAAAALVLFAGAARAGDPPAGRFAVLKPEAFAAELGENAAWFRENVPLFECPDRQIQEIYYFRWRVYKKHIRETPDGFVVTEFYPRVGWSGKHNTISCAAGHHLREGRWIADPKYINDYATFWFRKGGDPRRYSFWAADAFWARFLVDLNKSLVVDLLPDLTKNFEAWEKARLDPGGLFWQIDDRDGMEVSIGGSGFRPTINSYLYGDATAIVRIADLAGKPEIAAAYREKAVKLKALVQAKLWDPEAKFFKTLPRGEGKNLADVRELHGFTPWYFHLPDPGKGYEVAWKQLMDEQGFYAPFGPTTAERRHPRFRFKHGHDCLWNGPSWPYATTQTLVAMANVLNDYPQDAVTKADYIQVLGNYARSQYKDGKPWIAENLDGITGTWIVDKPRSADYNHSGYCDLVISGLAGLRPREDATVEVNPLIPPGTLDYFCLDGVRYHGKNLTILYDKSGSRYGKGAGLRVLAGGKEIGASAKLEIVSGRLSLSE
jgi:hypothetical protein